MCCFNAHIVNIVKHAKYLSYLFFCSYHNHSPGFYIHLVITYVRPLLEVNTVIWSPSYVCIINMIEDVQKQFTRRLCSHLNYFDLLKHFSLKSLEERRLMFDLYELFHVIHMHNYHKFNSHFVLTHSLQFSMNFCLVYSRTKFQRHFWFSRAIHYWNFLSYKVNVFVSSTCYKKLNVLLPILILMSFLQGMPMHRALLLILC